MTTINKKLVPFWSKIRGIAAWEIKRDLEITTLELRGYQLLRKAHKMDSNGDAAQLTRLDHAITCRQEFILKLNKMIHPIPSSPSIPNPPKL